MALPVEVAGKRAQARERPHQAAPADAVLAPRRHEAAHVAGLEPDQGRDVGVPAPLGQVGEELAQVAPIGLDGVGRQAPFRGQPVEPGDRRARTSGAPGSSRSTDLRRTSGAGLRLRGRRVGPDPVDGGLTLPSGRVTRKVTPWRALAPGASRRCESRSANSPRKAQPVGVPGPAFEGQERRRRLRPDREMREILGLEGDRRARRGGEAHRPAAGVRNTSASVNISGSRGRVSPSSAGPARCAPAARRARPRHRRPLGMREAHRVAAPRSAFTAGEGPGEGRVEAEAVGQRLGAGIVDLAGEGQRAILHRGGDVEAEGERVMVRGIRGYRSGAASRCPRPAPPP